MLIRILCLIPLFFSVIVIASDLCHSRERGNPDPRFHGDDEVALAQNDSNSLNNFSDQIKFHADYYERDEARGEIIARGNVELSFEGDSVSCPEVRINTKTKDIIAEGPLVFRTKGFIATASRMSYNLSTRYGVLEKAEIVTEGAPGRGVTDPRFELKSGIRLSTGAPKARFRGERIEKGPGSTNWVVYNGEFTNCVDCKIPEWKFTGSKLRTTDEGYVIINNPVFEVFEFPVGYLPFLAVPYDSKRKSGFLAPGFTISNIDEYTIKNQFYLTMGRSQDATFSWEYLGKRGNRPGVEYRYRFAENAGGVLKGYYMHDRKFEQDCSGNPKCTPDRFAARLTSFSFFDPGIDLKSDVNYVSDDEYIRQYPDEIPGSGDASVQSTIIAAKHWDLINFNSDILFYEDITTADPLASNAGVVQRLPEVQGTLLQIPFFDSHLTFRMFTGYGNFFTENDVFQNVNGVPGYQMGADYLLRAQRFDYRPEVSFYYSPIEGFQFIPEFAYQQSFYVLPTGGDNGGEFRYISVGGTAWLNLEKFYEVNWGTLKRMRHLIQPQVRYSYLPEIYKDNIPVLMDLLSTTTTRNLLNYKIASYLDLKREFEDSVASYLRAIELDISQGFDIQKALGSGDELTPVLMKLEFFFPYVQSNSQLRWDVNGKGIDWFSTGWGVEDPLQNSYFTSFSYNKADDRKNIKGGASLNFLPWLKGFFNLEFSFDDHEFIEQVYGMSYIPKTQCWRLDLGFVRQFDADVKRGIIGLNLIYGIQDGFDRFGRYKQFF